MPDPQATDPMSWLTRALSVDVGGLIIALAGAAAAFFRWRGKGSRADRRARTDRAEALARKTDIEAGEIIRDELRKDLADQRLVTDKLREDVDSLSAERWELRELLAKCEARSAEAERENALLRAHNDEQTRKVSALVDTVQRLEASCPSLRGAPCERTTP